MNIKENIMLEEGYLSSKEMLNDVYLLNSLSKKEQYKAEIEYFEKKYGMKFSEFKKNMHREKGYEDFQKEEDFEDWEFSVNALKWWSNKAKELKVA